MCTAPIIVYKIITYNMRYITSVVTAPGLHLLTDLVT